MTNYRDGKQISGCHGTGIWGNTGKFLCGDGTVTYLDFGGSYTDKAQG